MCTPTKLGHTLAQAVLLRAPITQAAFLAIALAAIAGMTGAYLHRDQPASIPATRGSHPLGRVLFDWMDSRRNRELMVFVWYPAKTRAAGHTAPYLPMKWGELAGWNRTVMVNAIEGAAIAEGKLPLLILSPGMGRIPTDYTTIAEDLASYGYVVAGVTPTGSARVVVFSDGRVVKGSEGVDLEHRERAHLLIERWVGDFSFVLDKIGAETFFVQSIRPDRIGVFGHSFGGAAAIHALRTDQRFRRGANLDGAPQGDLAKGLKQPLLVIWGAPLPARQKALNDRINADMQAICTSDLAGCQMEDHPEAGHMNFSDAAILPVRFPALRFRQELTNIDGLAFLRKTTDLLRAFFDQL